MAFCTSCGSPVDGQFCVKCGAQVGASMPAEPQQSAPAYVPPVPRSQAPPVPKKGRFVIWILLGCGGLILIGAIIAISTGLFVAYKAKQAGLDPALMQKNPGLAVAKMMASMSPDTEVLSVDEDHGIIRVRDKKTGKILTMNLEDAKNGKIVFLDENNQKVEIQSRGEGENASLEVKSPDGTVRVGATAANLPDWLPSYPGAEAKGTFGLDAKNGKAGSYSFQTNDSAENVGKFYEDALKKAGLEVQKNSTQVPGQGSMIILAGTDNASQRTVQVTAISKGEGATVSLTFEAKK